MKISDILIVVNKRNSLCHLATTCNKLVVEWRSRFGGICCDLSQDVNSEAVNQHKYALSTVVDC